MIVTVISVILPVTQPLTICIPVSCDREMTGQVDGGDTRDIVKTLRLSPDISPHLIRPEPDILMAWSAERAASPVTPGPGRCLGWQIMARI